MKYQHNLLPKEYRLPSQSYLGVYLLIIVIILAFSLIGWNLIKNNTEYLKTKSFISEKNKTLNKIYLEIKDKKPDYESVQELYAEVEFINKNLNTPATDVVVFLNSLEACVPKEIVITDMSPKKLDNLNVPFTLFGEAQSIDDVNKFVGNLNDSGKFKTRVISNKSNTISEIPIQNFVLECSYKL